MFTLEMMQKGVDLLCNRMPKKMIRFKYSFHSIRTHSALRHPIVKDLLSQMNGPKPRGGIVYECIHFFLDCQ